MRHRNIRLSQHASEEMLLRLADAGRISLHDPRQRTGCQGIGTHRARPSATGTLKFRYNHIAPGELTYPGMSFVRCVSLCVQSSRNHRVLTGMGAELAAAAALLQQNNGRAET